MMTELPVSGAIAEYRGHRLPIQFGGDDWVAVRPISGVEIPDALAEGESTVGPGQYEPWVKIPRSALEGTIGVTVTGALAGHTVSLRRRLPDGRILVEFVGPPAVAKELGLEGDQYMGWAGLVNADELKDIHVEETAAP